MPSQSQPLATSSDVSEPFERLTEQSLSTTVSAQITRPGLSRNDRLSILPPELLAIIFELVKVAKGEKQLLGGISKSLLPYSEATLYRTVKFRDLNRFLLFLRTINSSKERGDYLASLVRHFKVNLQSKKDEEDNEWSDVDGHRVFKPLVNVEIIVLHCCPVLLTALLSPTLRNANSTLPSLKVLDICAWPSSGNGFITERFIQLASFPSLEKLALYFYVTDEEDPEDLDLPPLRSIPSNFNFGLTDLQLGGTFIHNTAPQDDFATFLSYFGSLKRLTLFDAMAHGRLDFKIALQKVHSGLDYLDVSQHWSSLEEEPTFGKVLGRFTQLRFLELGKNTFSRRVLSALPACDSLEVLRVTDEWWSARQFFALADLLSPGVRSRQLTNLILDAPSTKDSGVPPLRQGNDLILLDSIPLNPALYGWVLPEWPDDFGLLEAQAFVESAAKVGLEVTGTLLDAIRIHQKWNEGILGIKERLAAQQKEEDEKR